MLNSKNIATLVTGLATLAALFLVVDRGGLIAWSVLVLGAALLAKIWFKPSKADMGLGIGLASIGVLAWFGTLYYVISTYESGEVVELSIKTNNGAHTARLWVLDIGADPVVYYDADPEVAASLLAGTPLQFTRSGKVSTRIPKATPVATLPEDEANRILSVMESKYRGRTTAADVYYLMLGNPRDRVALIASLTEE